MSVWHYRYKSSSLRHDGVYGMKWGYTDGKRNGRRVAGDEEDTKKKKSEKDDEEHEAEVKKLANEVMRGNYGNGEDRKKALGDKYAEIQSRVNEMLGVKNPESLTKALKESKKSKDSKDSETKKKSTKKKSTKKTKSEKVSEIKNKVTDLLKQLEELEED